MKPTITLALLLVTAILFSQQTPSPSVGGEAIVPQNTQACVTPEQHEELFRQVEDNIALLKQQGRYLQPNKQGNHPLFILPVAQVEGFDYHNVWGFSNYVDHNSNFPNQIQDYNCGTRSYDTTGGYNHTGYDIFTWPFWWLQMELNQSINIAGAGGQIIFKQDGNFDKNCSFNSNPLNGMGIQHSDGSRSFYFHFKNGEITDKNVGDMVVEGEYLGVIGSSGSSTGPHAHFEVFDNDNNLIDPSIGACNNLNPDTWWADPIGYTNPGINAVLTHTQFPEFNPCPETETTHESNQFELNATVRLAIYLRDQMANSIVSLRTIRPDGSVQFEWDFDLVDQFQLSWWAWEIPADMEGTWAWEATYLGETVTHNFDVGVLSVEDEILNTTSIYPNPTQSLITMQFQEVLPDATVTVSNVLGQKILQRELSNVDTTTLEIPGSAGLYFINLTIANKTATYKIIKE